MGCPEVTIAVKIHTCTISFMGCILKYDLVISKGEILVIFLIIIGVVLNNAAYPINAIAAAKNIYTLSIGTF